ncbi:hypothetical protein IFM61606_07717 [Aspergillus udagawae]|nr:hypothetical protein IFM61606_07717 [Aspergillus udagawae]
MNLALGTCQASYQLTQGHELAKLLNPSYFTLNETDNKFLTALSKIFTDVGKKVTVTQSGVSGTPVTSPQPSGFRKEGPALVMRWRRDIRGQGRLACQLVPKKGDANVRVSFVDRATHKYRQALYVVDTGHGLRVFDVGNIWKVERGDGIGKMAGGGYSAANYEYVIPRTRVYNWTELQLGSKFGIPSNGILGILCNILRMQGGFPRNDTFYLGGSSGQNDGDDLFTWTPGEAAIGSSYFPPGNEDPSYNEAKREWYTVKEWQN